jgi:Raf kinase inhibitor-like YbhB/YbcL family protein
VGAGGRPLLAGILAAAALAGCGGGSRPSATPAGAPAASFTFASPAVGATIPRRYTCDGAGTSPPLRWSGAPRAAELVLVVQDPDASGGTFVHWTAFAIVARRLGLIPAGARLRSGENSVGQEGWTPPCPPKGDPPHHYEFSLYALRRPSELKPGASPAQVRAKLAGALARGSFTATYGRATGRP